MLSALPYAGIVQTIVVLSQCAKGTAVLDRAVYMAQKNPDQIKITSRSCKKRPNIKLILYRSIWESFATIKMRGFDLDPI
jgi:hypothetical protein